MRGTAHRRSVDPYVKRCAPRCTQCKGAVLRSVAHPTQGSALDPVLLHPVQGSMLRPVPNPTRELMLRPAPHATRELMLLPLSPKARRFARRAFCVRALCGLAFPPCSIRAPAGPTFLQNPRSSKIHVPAESTFQQDSCSSKIRAPAGLPPSKTPDFLSSCTLPFPLAPSLHKSHQLSPS